MAGYAAYGTVLGYSTARQTLDLTTAPTEWDYIGELTNIGGPSITVNPIDVTSHDSADAYNEFVAGLIDGGDVTLDGNLVSAAAGNEMVDLSNERIVACFYVKFPTTGTSTSAVSYDSWLFTGIANAFETDAPHDGKIGFSAGIKLSGKPFLTSTYAT